VKFRGTFEIIAHMDGNLCRCMTYARAPRWRPARKAATTRSSEQNSKGSAHRGFETSLWVLRPALEAEKHKELFGRPVTQCDGK
jgi:hypothetical protein